jgi:hypothetical protein
MTSRHHCSFASNESYEIIYTNCSLITLLIEDTNSLFSTAAAVGPGTGSAYQSTHRKPRLKRLASLALFLPHRFKISWALFLSITSFQIQIHTFAPPGSKYIAATLSSHRQRGDMSGTLNDECSLFLSSLYPFSVSTFFCEVIVVPVDRVNVSFPYQ